MSQLPLKPIGSFSLKDPAGKSVQTPDPKAVLTVAFFVIPECPIANRYSPEIKRICDAYESKKVAFRLVFADPDVTATQAKKHLKDFGLDCPGILDSKMALSKATGATISPEAAVLDPTGKVLYRGRIDDLYVSHGNRRPNPKRRDLRIAIDEALSGKPVSVPVTTTTGCYLRVDGK